MSFESTTDVLGTLQDYSRLVVQLYGRKAALTSNLEVRVCLEDASRRELQLQTGASGAVESLSAKLQSAQFKWHDKRQLFKTLEDVAPAKVDDVQDAVELVEQCSRALLAYYDGLTASTNSNEVLSFIEALSQARRQDLRQFVFQAERGLQ